MAKTEEKNESTAVAPQQALSLTAEQLLTLINESKKPTQEDQAIQAKKMAAKRRQVEQDVAVQQEITDNRLAQIANCSHLRRDGSCRAVFIKGNANRPGDYGYLHCQKCHANIYPEQQLALMPKSHILGAIYDTKMFNQLVQMASASNIGD